MDNLEKKSQEFKMRFHCSTLVSRLCIYSFNLPEKAKFNSSHNGFTMKLMKLISYLAKTLSFSSPSIY